MQRINFQNYTGKFTLKDPEKNSYLYFPIANEIGVMSSLTPTLNGDCKMNQNTFLLAPVSSEDLHNNKSSRNFWIYVEGKTAWSVTGVSSQQQSKVFSKEKEETEIECSIMCHKVIRTSKEMGLKSEIINFVPNGYKVELMKVTITNISEEDINITPTAAIPLYCRSADNIRDHRHVTSLLHRIETINSGVIVKPTLTFDERGHKINEIVYGVIAVDEDKSMPISFSPIVEEFIGEGGSFENPESIMLNKEFNVKSGEKFEGYESIGALRFKNEKMKPNESKSYIIAFGYGESVDDFEKLTSTLLKETDFEELLKDTKLYWENKINLKYNTGDSTFNNWMHWVNFQPILRRIYGCSFLPHHDYGKGGRGWRDLWQDCLALLAMDPKEVREMLLNNFAGVRFDGSNATIIGANLGEFIADRNNITRVWMDHGAWPFLTTNLYINQSGDINFLLEKQSYFKDLQTVRGTDKDNLWSIEQGNKLLTKENNIYLGTILEHILVQHLTAFYDVGENNNMRLRGADWNDALDMAKEKGESVAFTALYSGNLVNICELLKKIKNENKIKHVEMAEEIEVLLFKNNIYDYPQEKINILNTYCKSCNHDIKGRTSEIDIDLLVKDLEEKANWIKNHINSKEWITNSEGYSWYNGYYDNSGKKVEGDFESGTRMMLTGQVFTIMSNIATEKQVKEIVKAADSYLYDKEVGGYRLNTNFKELKMDLGRMFGFAYGSKENGAVFSHMTIMYANALYQRGFVKEGFKVIDALYKHCINFEVSKIYPGIPEYISSKGRGMYHYLTGSASWLILTVLTEMFGVKGSYGDMKLDPKLLLSQFDEDNKASISLVFSDRKFKVEYINELHKDFGEYKIQEIFINNETYEFDNLNTIDKKYINSLEVDKEHIITVILK
ncbi:cellobiose phosphorylase [Clostridium sp. C8]|uniref:GH36-type glycosyl hydrolase domain-containing protein n=1 Tax=Clostridium sp. C8 TaxID=1667357 RepID=UPI00062E5870|nr:cellobiose phosphorylase [Clostridium sp. C8]KLE14703.1 cellobiose phosphorylase [Clostridium sp. C8]